MVAVVVGVLEVVKDVVAVLDHRFEESSLENRCEFGRVGEQRRRPQPVHRADGDFHRPAPVDAVRPGIVVEPGLELIAELGRVTRLAVEGVRTAERDPVVAAA